MSKEEKIKSKVKAKSSGYNGGEEEIEDKKRENFGFDTTLRHILNANTTLTASLMFQKSKETKDKIKSAYKADNSLDKIEIENEDKSDKELSLKFTGTSIASSNHILDYGIDFMSKKRDKNKNKVEIKNGVTKPKTEAKDKYKLEEKRVNLFLQDEYVINENHILTSGIRYEWAQNSSKDTSNKEFENSNALLNPSLNYLYHLNSSNDIRVGLAKTVTRLKFDDLSPYVELKDGVYKIGNVNLKPETAYGIDVSIEHYFENKKGLLSANVFYRDIKDKMQKNTSFNDATLRLEEMTVNQGDANIKGLEFEANYDLSTFVNNLSITSNITFMDGEILDKTTGKTLPMDDTPDYVYNIGFDHSIYKTSWGMNYNFVSSREKVNLDGGKRSEEYTKAQERLDFYLKQNINKTYSLNFAINNILETKKDKTKTNYKADGSLDNKEFEIEKSQRVFLISFVGKF